MGCPIRSQFPSKPFGMQLVFWGKLGKSGRDRGNGGKAARRVGSGLPAEYIARFMRLSAGQYAVRLSCGFGLLLMPAVQEKLCAWPVSVESASPQSAEPVTPPTSNEQPKQKKKQPLTLAAMLPDVVAPRWPGHALLMAGQRVRTLPVATWMDGPASFDDQSGAGPGSDALIASAWSRCPTPQVLPTIDVGGSRSHRAHRHVFRTSILRTGPPRS